MQMCVHMLCLIWIKSLHKCHKCAHYALFLAIFTVFLKMYHFNLNAGCPS